MGKDVILRQGVSGYVDSYVDPYKTDPTPPPPYTGWMNQTVVLSPTVPLIRLTIYQPSPPVPPAQTITPVVLSPTVPLISISVNPNIVLSPPAKVLTNIILRVPAGAPTDVYLRSEDFKSYILTLKDSIQLSERYSSVPPPGGGGTIWTKTLTDTLSLSDFFSSNLIPGGGTAWTKDLSDALSLADAIISRGMGKSITGNAISLSDAPVKNIQIYKSTDAVSLVDAIVKSIKPTYADTVSLSDLIYKSIGKTHTDTVSLSESFLSSLFKQLALGDTITLSDLSVQVLTSGPLVVVITEALPSRALSNYRGFGADPKRPETPFDIRNLSGFRDRT